METPLHEDELSKNRLFNVEILEIRRALARTEGLLSKFAHPNTLVCGLRRADTEIPTDGDDSQRMTDRIDGLESIDITSRTVIACNLLTFLTEILESVWK